MSSPVVTLRQCPPNKLPIPALKTTIGSTIGSTSTPTCYVITSPSYLARTQTTPQQRVPTPDGTRSGVKVHTPRTVACIRTGTDDNKNTLKRLARSAEANRCKRRIDFAYAGLSKSKCESIAKRNARERNRVKQVNNGFDTLREHLPLEGVVDKNKMSKVETLRNAIDYIKQLNYLLHSDDARKTFDAMQSTFAAASNPPSMSIDIPTEGGSFRDLLLSPTLSIDSTGRSTGEAEWTSESPSPPEYVDMDMLPAPGTQNLHTLATMSEHHNLMVMPEHHVMPQDHVMSHNQQQGSPHAGVLPGYARWFQ